MHALKQRRSARAAKDPGADDSLDYILTALDCRDTMLPPHLVIALRDGKDTSLTIGETAVHVALNTAGHGSGTLDQALKVWTTILDVVRDVNDQPYLPVRIANLPEQVTSLRWPTPHGPVTVTHAAGAHGTRRHPKCRSRRGPASLIPVLGFGGPKVAALVTACVSVCVVAVPGGPITSLLPTQVAPSEIRTVFVPPSTPPTSELPAGIVGRRQAAPLEADPTPSKLRLSAKPEPAAAATLSAVPPAQTDPSTPAPTTPPGPATASPATADAPTGPSTQPPGGAGAPAAAQ